MTHAFFRQMTVLTFLTTSAIYFVTPLQAAEYQDAQISSFSQLDTNKDGFIDRQEAANTPQLLKVWPQADANKDGKLSPEEFSAITTPPTAK